jgi:putative transposase
MTEILALLQGIAPIVSATILQQMSHVIYGMLISNGRITMLEISRWTETGGSYRTIVLQKSFFHQARVRKGEGVS